MVECSEIIDCHTRGCRQQIHLSASRSISLSLSFCLSVGLYIRGIESWILCLAPLTDKLRWTGVCVRACVAVHTRTLRRDPLIWSYWSSSMCELLLLNAATWLCFSEWYPSLLHAGDTRAAFLPSGSQVAVRRVGYLWKNYTFSIPLFVKNCWRFDVSWRLL